MLIARAEINGVSQCVKAENMAELKDKVENLRKLRSQEQETEPTIVLRSGERVPASSVNFEDTSEP